MHGNLRSHTITIIFILLFNIVNICARTSEPAKIFKLSFKQYIDFTIANNFSKQAIKFNENAASAKLNL